MDALKKKYNQLLKRERKAEKWIGEATDEQIEKWLPEFNKIIIELSQLIYLIEKRENRKITQQEALEGFREVCNDNKVS